MQPHQPVLIGRSLVYTSLWRAKIDQIRWAGGCRQLRVLYPPSLTKTSHMVSNIFIRCLSSLIHSSRLFHSTIPLLLVYAHAIDKLWGNFSFPLMISIIRISLFLFDADESIYSAIIMHSYLHFCRVMCDFTKCVRIVNNELINLSGTYLIAVVDWLIDWLIDCLHSTQSDEL
jgi:hypothetical protein